MRWLPVLAAAVCLVAFEPTSFAGPKCAAPSAQKAKAKKVKYSALSKQTKRHHAKAKSAPPAMKAKPKPAKK